MYIKEQQKKKSNSIGNDTRSVKIRANLDHILNYFNTINTALRVAFSRASFHSPTTSKSMESTRERRQNQIRLDESGFRAPQE